MVPSPAANSSRPLPAARPRVESPSPSLHRSSPAPCATMSSKVLSNAGHRLEPVARHPELEHLASSMPATTIDSVRSQSRMSISHAKGLLNYPGQNNCFLNSAVQVLWHLDIFRRSFRELHGHACMGDSCIFCALKELFNQFQSSKESALPPDSLRFALAEAFSDQRRFQMGFMDDAAECFENILLRIHYHLTNQEVSEPSSQCLPHCITHQKFAMNLFEQISCHSCGATSEPFFFSQMVHYASTTALCSQEKLFKGESKLSFGSLLKMATSMGDIRNCPKMCGTRISIKKVLVNRPDVISVCLIWDSEHATLPLIRNVFQLIETSIQLQEVFELSAPYVNTQLNLVGFVTYYGRHYSSYMYNTNKSEWVYFDDATVRVIGPSWQHVVERCLKGRFQPLLLLYANPNGSVVNTQHALTDAVPMTVLKKHSSEPFPKVCSTKASDTKPTNKTNPISTRKEPTYLDVPDSPSATSTTSYFSDVGDSTDGYIVSKAVERILNVHQQIKEKRDLNLIANLNKSNRNSSSSIDSFDSAHRLNSTIPRTNGSGEGTLTCFLQRRDSGNSSGERSSSVSSVDYPFYPYRRPLKNAPRQTNKQNSDQGYDSFSLSSTDSYPATSNANSFTKLACHNTLRQIPEDVQLLEGIQFSSECDQLCSEVDILLHKSALMEKEGDLRAAAALSDSAAAKARIAMDAPYSNHQTLITAKKKHSICVLQSTKLHKLVKEKEEGEKKMLKAQLEHYHHSRQSSRDSTHGRHSRQGSRDGKDPKMGKESPSSAIKMPSNVEIYATLPKKAKRKFLFKGSNGNLEPIERANLNECTESKSQMLNNSSILTQLQNENIRNECIEKQSKSKELPRESDFSDYYSEWEGLKKSMPSKGKSGAGSGWQSCRENDSEVYGEVGVTAASTARKQCKVKRKLLLGGLLKSKNRSMPDLREDTCGVAGGEEGANRTSVANINAKGFHQSHRSFVTEQGLSSKPALVKVKPPLITTGDITSQVGKNSENESIYANINYSPVPIVTLDNTLHTETTSQLKMNEQQPVDDSTQSSNPFLIELNKKRNEILKRYNSREKQDNNQIGKVIPVSASQFRKPSPHQIADFISTSKNRITSNQCPALMADLPPRVENIYATRNSTIESSPSPIPGSIYAPIPIHAAMVTRPALAPSGPTRPIRPPDYQTALRRIEMRSIPDRHGTHSVPTNVAFPLYQKVANHREPIQFNVPAIPRHQNQQFAAHPKPIDCTFQNQFTAPTERLVEGAQIILPTLTSTDKPADRRAKLTKKKSVKFSDQIELVQCGDYYDDPEEHLPNPLLEKVLSNKAVVYTLNK